MIIDTQLDIIFRCADCEGINGTPISIFDLNVGRELEIKSSCCRVESVVIRQISEDKYLVSFPCPVCGQKHKQEISFNSMWKSALKFFACDETGIRVLAVADYNNTENAINALEEDYDGLEELFEQTLSDDDRLLVSALNALNDLAIDEKISCECENKNIIFELTEDSLVLKCPECGRSQAISVSDIKILEQIIGANELVIEKTVTSGEKRAKILEFKPKR